MTAIKKEREDVVKGDFPTNIAVPKSPKGESAVSHMTNPKLHTPCGKN